MHTLKPTPAPSPALFLGRKKKHVNASSWKSSENSAVNLADAMEDLGEIEYLLKDLRHSVSVSVNEQSAYFFHISELIRKLEGLEGRVRYRRAALENPDLWTRKDELANVLKAARSEFIAIKSDLRLAFKQRGAFLCGDDWQSPVYDSSINIAKNRLSTGIAEHVLDYKRDGHLEAMAYEAQFLKQYASHLASKSLQAYLTNSGMAAFSTVLNWLTGELQMRDSALAIMPMYFENIHLAKASFANLQASESRSKEELRTLLDTLDPSVVFCDAITNCNEVLYHDLEELMDWARTKKFKKIAIVIDTTCLPLPFVAPSLLAELPENVIVVLVESLAKYHQMGMDAVTGGVVVLHANQETQDSFRKTRARLGTNIADTSVGSLPQPDRGILRQRMLRHSRNVRILCERIDEMSENPGGVFESVECLRIDANQTNSASSTAMFWGTCFTLRLRKQFRSIKFYQDLEKKVLEKCQQQSHPVAFSTSFGFDVSRFYVTAPSTRFEEPFLRVSVGTESLSQIEKLASILQQCNEELAGLWTAPSTTGTPVLLKFGKTTPATVEPEKNGYRGSVFAGVEGLRNYLSPENYAPTPLVELPADLNPYLQDGVHIFAKIVPLVPLMNIKSIPAFSMLNEAALRGDLDKVQNIIESSSSNTVLSLSVIARLFGIDRTFAIVDHSLAPGLARMLRLFGIEILQHPAAGHDMFGKLAPRSERAFKLGSQDGWYNPGQYSNKDNPAGFAQYLAPDIWKQTDGKIDLLSCALGTCGTMVGVSRGLRRVNPDIQVIACCPARGEAVPGPREKSLLHDVTFDWKNVANQRFELGARESFDASIKLLRRGLMAGPSSGMNYAGTLQYLSEKKESGELQSMIDSSGGELTCVFLCCDSPLPHIDEYFDALGEDYFPTIHPVPEAD